MKEILGNVFAVVFAVWALGIGVTWMMWMEDMIRVPGWAFIGWPWYAIICFWDSYREWKEGRK